MVFKIEGMDCAACAMNIEGDLEDSGGVMSCRVNYAKSQTEVEFDTEEISEEEIVEMIGKTGYKVSL